MAKILVIDDEAGMLQIITKILGPLGHSVLTAEDGSQGLLMVQTERPDLVLADIHLPGMEGGAVLSTIKRVDPRVPVIILSGFGDVDIAADLVRRGASDYLSKPFKINDLILLVQKALGKPPVAFPASGELKPSVVSPAATHEAAPAPQAGPSSTPVPSRIKKIFSIAVPAAVIITAGIFVFKYAASAPPQAEFAISYANPSGICWDGNTLWVADWAGETVRGHARDAALSAVKSFKTPGVEPSGIAFDGEFIWISNSLGQRIFKYRGDGTTVTSFASPGPSPSGLFFDGKNLWSADFQQGKIYKHRMDYTLSVDSSFDSPAANPCAIFGRGKHLFIADSKTNRVYKVRPDTFSLAGIYVVAGFENQERHIAGAAWDGKSLWVCSDGVERIFRYRMKDLTPAKL